jgi:hypothetical protein
LKFIHLFTHVICPPKNWGKSAVGEFYLNSHITKLLPNFWVKGMIHPKAGSFSPSLGSTVKVPKSILQAGQPGLMIHTERGKFSSKCTYIALLDATQMSSVTRVHHG